MDAVLNVLFHLNICFVSEKVFGELVDVIKDHSYAKENKLECKYGSEKKTEDLPVEDGSWKNFQDNVNLLFSVSRYFLYD